MVISMKASGLGAGLLLLAASGLVWHGQPGPEEKWGFLAAELGPRLTHREVQIEPAELLSLMHDDYINLILVDVRDERDWNLFHLWGAERLKPGQLLNSAKRFRDLPENSVIVLVSNDELAATEVWKQLMAAASRPNAYVLAGGINRWLNEFTADGRSKPRTSESESPNEKLRHSFEWALGSRHPASLPDPHYVGTHQFTKKVKLLKRVVRKGGCG